MSMIHTGEPLWVKKSDGEEVLNLKYYLRVLAHGLVDSEVEFVTEATRASGIVCINGLTLVEIMMNVVCFKMVNNFYRGISIGLSNSVWEKLSPASLGEDIRIMSRKNLTDPEEAMGIVLSASTSLWLPISRRRVFEFLMREDIRKDWDFLINGWSLDEIVRIPKAQTHGNSISILRVAVSTHIGCTFI
ncbi:Homeobox-leucine zipper protein ROC5 [Linum perenne]